MYRIIDGKTVSQGVKDSVRDELTALKTEMGLTYQKRPFRDA